MNFKEILAKDLDTFINPQEFGTTAILEGEQVGIVVDNDRLAERKLKMGEGLHSEELLFYVKKSILSFYPRTDNRVIFDDVQWRVKEVHEDEGLFTITVELVGA